jgi:hypothetical protein
MSHIIPSRIVPSAQPSERTPRQIGRDFRKLIAAGAEIRCAGEARDDPESLLAEGYAPRYALELFDSGFYLSGVRQNEHIRFFVAWVVQDHPRRRGKAVYPRIFYKDVSLIWRSASHYVSSEDEHWIGKGEMTSEVVNGQEIEYSVEATTDLPLEIQSALEEVSRRPQRIPTDEVALYRVLHGTTDNRIAPYADFSAPRRRARANPRNLVNGGRPVARFSRRNDPTSLRFTPGYEPDFARGVLEQTSATSRLYGGELRRFRILSRNRRIQYLFMAGAQQVWIVPPQATTTELSSYGVRTIDVRVDEDLCIPGYEYHFIDDTEDPPLLVSQIPEGFVGPVSEFDASRADAAPWLDRMPVVREFRAEVLGAQLGSRQIRNPSARSTSK